MLEGDVAECAPWQGRRKMSSMEGCLWARVPSTLRGWQWKGGNGREEQNPFKKAEKRVWSLNKQIRSLTPDRAPATFVNIISDGFLLLSELDLFPDFLFVSTYHFPPVPLLFFCFSSPVPFSPLFPVNFSPKIHLHLPNPIPTKSHSHQNYL